MCVQYWPVLVDREEAFGDITVTLLKEEQLANFVIRTIRLKKDGEVSYIPSPRRVGSMSVVPSVAWNSVSM